MEMAQSAIVTGGSSGIGKAVAHRLAERGINVLVADINVADGQKVSDELKIKYQVDSVFVKLDTVSEDDAINMVKTVVDRWGKLDWACNCAGKAEIMTDNEVDITAHDFDRYVFFLSVYSIENHVLTRLGQDVRDQPTRHLVLPKA